jgi:hypothetical protein
MPAGEWGKFLLVLIGNLVKVKATMKRLLTLIALLGLAVGVFAGCNQSGTTTGTSTDTNAPPAAASTNK